jgi:hypothetical protein
MISIAKRATAKLQELLASPSGLNANVAALARSEGVTLSPIPTKHLFTDNVASDVAERSMDLKYTAIYVYCEGIVNTLKEKFRSVSGTAQMVIDVRVSQDRLEGIDGASQLYTDAVAQTLGQSRGDWGQGLFYSGAYQISFGPVKHGGRNFIKTAKVSFDLDVSID